MQKPFTSNDPIWEPSSWGLGALPGTEPCSGQVPGGLAGLSGRALPHGTGAGSTQQGLPAGTAGWAPAAPSP